jgi:glutamate--cysteine ligase
MPSGEKPVTVRKAVRFLMAMLTTQRLTRADVAQLVAGLFRDSDTASSPGCVGVEIEWIPAQTEASPPGPVGVARSSQLLTTVPDVAAEGHVTYEPGGQIEMSPGPSNTVVDLLASIDTLETRLRACLKQGGVELFSSGVNPWHTVDELGLQTPGPRYSAMQAHFDAIGTAGRRMMRQTAALQVCLDAGGPTTWFNRWRLANLAGPALSAAFANSPLLDGNATGIPGTRSCIWQRVDSSRTGFDGAQVGRDATAARESYLSFALEADFIPLSDTFNSGDSVSQGRPFEELIADDSTCLDVSDAAHHLSTLFPPVRPRRHLEVRYLDALPSRWLPVAVALLASLLYEPHATNEALEALDQTVLDRDAWARAGSLGMGDPALRSTALALFDAGLRGAARLPKGFLPGDMLERMSEYRERFPESGRAPADEQLESFTSKPEALSTWR